MMDWVYLAAGFTGALTVSFLYRLVLGSGDSGAAQVLFAPADNPLDAVKAALATARKEVLVQATAFAAPEVAKALVEAKLRGVTVEVLLDVSQERDPASVLPFLLEQGLAPLIDHENRASSTQAIVIDQRTVLTGGHALVPAQDGDNAECLVVLRDQPAVAARFRQQFFLFREHARPPQLRGRPAATTTPTPAPAPTPATPPMSETLARLLPGLQGVELPTEQQLAEKEKAA